MNVINVSTAKPYKVMIGSGIIASLGHEAIKITSPCKAVIISDSNVWPLYGAAVQQSLEASGYEVFHFAFKAGESSKNMDTYLSILNFFAEKGMSRTDLAVALGGGVVGDITGFAAATYMRGVRYIQIPTSLLAMVDSSVGGKTAIDLSAGKNLVGAFYQPSLVLCDTATLLTLPDQIFTDGCAEVLKYSILFDAALFEYFEEAGKSFDRSKVICRCIELKRDVVAQDEFDHGMRQLLNLGHTIGHAIEQLSHFTVTHGQAVSIGTAIVSRAAAQNGICPKEDAERICKLLSAFGLPINTAFAACELHGATLSDKKRSGETVNLIIPNKIGECRVQATPISTLQSFIEAGM